MSVYRKGKGEVEDVHEEDVKRMASREEQGSRKVSFLKAWTFSWKVNIRDSDALTTSSPWQEAKAPAEKNVWAIIM